MTRLTLKYRCALDVAMRLNMVEVGDELYKALELHEYFWDSNVGKWELHPVEQAEPPTKLVNIRVWADAEIVEDAADDLIRSYQQLGFSVAQKSERYLCRPPKQLEARVYVAFIPPEKKIKQR